MNLIEIKDEFKNSKVLLVVLGALLFPAINSLDNLLFELYKALGITLIYQFVLSIAFQALILIGLCFVIYSTISSQKSEDNQAKILLTRRSFKILGLVFILFIIVSRVVVFMISKQEKTPDLSQIKMDYATITYINIIQSSLRLMREVVLFLMYFIIVFKRDTKMSKSSLSK